MKMIEVIWFGYFMTYVWADGVADVVLSCSLVEQGVGLGGMGGGSLFTQTPATLVLRDVAVTSDESLETFTSFVPPSTPDPDAILFEAKVTSPEIPNANVLLHADCNDQEVICELSRYSSHGSQESSEPAYFLVSINVEGVDFSTTLILQTLTLERDHSTLIQNKLNLPLSRSGTLLTEVVFLVFSPVKSVFAPLRSDVLLNCGFKQQEIPLAQQVDIEWRLQHRGKGQKVLEMKTRLDDLEGSTVVHAERRGSSMDAQVVGEGNASLTLTKLKMEWLFLSPTDTEPTVFKDQGSLSSHRQHGDGCYSLSSQLTVPSDISPGTKIICKVSHPALDAPLSVSVLVESPEPDSYWLVLGFLIITVLFFYNVIG
ncbi:hypothetical protein PAMP_002958 [Pampus punctatissimus]